MNPELTLERIADLIHEYHEIIRKHPLKDSKERERLSRVGYVLKQVTLTGEQLMQMQGFDPLVLGDNDVKRSSYYQELQKEYDRLQTRHEGLEGRYKTLVRKLKESFGPQFELKTLLDEQEEEEKRDAYS